MRPFQSEGGEKPKPSQPSRPVSASGSRPSVKRPRTTLEGPSLFGEEPEEGEALGGSRSSKSLPGTKSKATPSVLFGDEGEECSGQGESDVDDAPTDQTTTLNLDWSAMRMFEKACFLKKASELSKEPPKKRPYDNSKRAQSASASTRTSFKETALNPTRLTELKAKPQCKCA